MAARLRRWSTADGKESGASWWCQGCAGPHQVRFIGPEPVWAWNQDLEAPTFHPSVLVNRERRNPAAPVCHSMIEAGQMRYLEDCTHELAGRTVEIPPADSWPW